MGTEFIIAGFGAAFSAATFCCVWLFNKPQKVEMQAMRDKSEAEMQQLRDTLENVASGLKELSAAIQNSQIDRAAMNEQIKTLFKEIKDIKKEIEKLQEEARECCRGEAQCSKK